MTTSEKHPDVLPGAEERGFVDRLLEEYGSLQGLLFLLPALILLTGIVFIPAVRYALLLSFQEFTVNPDVANKWVGLDNYKYWLFGDGASLLRFSLRMSLLYVLVVVPLDLVMALGAALVMNENLPARPLFRGLTLAGYASPAAAAGLLFYLMEKAASYGIIYQMFDFFFKMPSSGGLIANQPWAFWGVVFAKVWRDFGFMYIVLLAGLQAIPKSLYEMAKVDGAGPVQRFRYVTLPHLRTVVVTVVMIRTVFTVGGIAIPWAITKGGPNDYTTFLGMAVFKISFVQWLLGRGATIGIFMAILTLPLIYLWVRYETEEVKEG